MRLSAFVTLLLFFLGRAQGETIATHAFDDVRIDLSWCPRVQAATVSLVLQPQSLVRAPGDVRRIERVLRSDDRKSAFLYYVSGSLGELNIGSTKYPTSSAVPFGGDSDFCEGVSALTTLLQTVRSSHDFAVLIKIWFQRYLPAYQPVFGKALAELLKSFPLPSHQRALDGVLIHPMIYAKAMNSKKVLISDLHDLTFHLPMLLDPDIRAMVELHFSVVATYLERNSFDDQYGILRRNFFEQFVYFDDSSQTLLGLGGFGQELGRSLLGLYEYHVTPTHQPEKLDLFFKMTERHAAWGQQQTIFASLKQVVADVAPQILADIPRFSELTPEKKQGVLLVYTSRYVASDARLSRYFSKKHQLKLWAEALKHFE